MSPFRQRVPYVAQATAADCGLACLAMSLARHGKQVPMEEIRSACGGSSILGVDARLLLEVGAHFGLRGQGVQLEGPEDLKHLDAGSILHWRFAHFVVFERLARGGAWILDPAHGRRWVSRSELDRSLTGVALTFTPSEGFEPQRDRRSLAARYLARLKPQAGLIAGVLALSLLIQLFALALPAATSFVIDRVLAGRQPSLLTMLGLGAAALVLFQGLSQLIRGHLLLALRTRLDASLTLDFVEHLVRLPYLFFQQRPAGDLLMRIGSHATIRETLTLAVVSAALDGFFVVLYLGLLLASDLRFGTLVVAFAAARLAVFLLTRARQQRLMTEALEAQSRSQSYQVQLLSGIETLKTSGAEQRGLEQFSRLFVGELNVSLARGRLDAATTATLDALSLAAPLALLLYGAERVLAGALSLGNMLALTALAAGALAPLANLAANAGRLLLLKSYLERLEDVLQHPTEPVAENPSRQPLLGAVRAERLSFRYGPLVPPALSDVCLEIPPGRLVAIVGPSGSGKSTLAALLAGLLPPVEGSLHFDGRALAELDLTWLRSQIGYVSQRPYLFGTSIRANLALAEPTTPLADLVRAARLAEIHDEISALPMGYETLLADGGTSLSGGQRQRLALARALVLRPRLLILDEATSALDTVTERRIQENLARLDTTRIVIAHRLSTVRDADWIVVLEHGRIVEQGTHEPLLRQRGRYHQLVEAQLTGPLGLACAS